MSKLAFQPDPQVIALGVRQPWVELILRGVKTLEVRSLATRQRGLIYLYASKQPANHPAAEAAIEANGLAVEELPSGLLVGSVRIAAVRRAEPADAPAACVRPEDLIGQYVWEFTDPVRFASPLGVRFLPYGVWFYPYRRRNG